MAVSAAAAIAPHGFITSGLRPLHAREEIPPRGAEIVEVRQGGCGELDVAEVLGGDTATPAHPDQATTTIYSFQGVTNGGTSYFQRPVYETATFVVVFDAPSRPIALRRLGATDFDFADVITDATVQSWLANAGTVRPMPDGG
jgi:hypothetical protein